VGGSLGDRFGRARILRIGLVVFGAASAVAAFSANATTLTFSRGCMGVGAALIFPASVAVLTNVFTDARQRGRALGVWTAAGGVGIALGPVLGGLLLSRFWWGSVFLVNVPVVAVALALGWWAIPESRNPAAARFDPLGVVLSVLSVTGLVWATIEAPSHGWASANTLGSFGLGFALLGAFAFWELRCPHPMVELGFFRNPRFSVGIFVASIHTASAGGTLFVMTQLLQSVFGYSPLSAGLRLLPYASIISIVGLISSRVAESIGTKRTVASGLFVLAAGLAILAVTGEHAGYGPVLAAMLAVGAGAGLMAAPITDAVIGAVPREQAGVASGTLSSGRQTGVALGIAVAGSLLVSGYRSVLAARTSGIHLSQVDRATAKTSLSAALGVAHHLGGDAGGALDAAARAGFVHGMHLGMTALAVLLALGAILALRYLPARAHDAPDHDVVPTPHLEAAISN
jgi:predicted MFS family arabinose efflux permease